MDMQNQRQSSCSMAEVRTLTMTVVVAVAMALLVAAVQNMVSAQAVCGLNGCQAWALFVVPPNDTLYLIANRFSLANFAVLQNLNNINNPDNIESGQLLRIPFACDCLGNDTIRYHSFSYSVDAGDLDYTVAMMKFSNLTTVDAIDSNNAGASSMLPGTVLKVPINCSCGDPAVSKDYGMFGTYVAQPNDTLSSLSHQFNISQELLRNYNPAVSFDPLQPFISILFIPTTNSSGQYPPLVTRRWWPQQRGHNKCCGWECGLSCDVGAWILAFAVQAFEISQQR